MPNPKRPSRATPKAVPVTYGALAGFLLLVVATVGLVFLPPSPPSVAEFAPQAQDQIEEALDQQSSRFGGGAGACAEGQVCEGTDGSGVGAGGVALTTTTAAPRRVIDKARVRRCVGDPPRQIEDPQSPPCVNYFEGDNGGATYRGVTRDSIRVGFARQGSSLRDPGYFLPFFNNRFEMYGRRIVGVDVPLANSTNPVTQPGDAAAAADAGVFAVILPAHGTTESYTTYRRELARRGIITIGALDTVAESELQRMAPYAYDYSASFTDNQRHTAEFACKSLVGRLARYGGADVQLRQRKFAVLVPDQPDFSTSDVDTLVTGIRRCGGDTSVHTYKIEYVITAPGPENQVLLADLTRTNVTTVIPYGGIAGVASLMKRASPMGYQPEWLLPGSRDQNQEVNFQSAPADQTNHLLSMVTLNKTMPLNDEPWFWAVRESGREHDRLNASPGYVSVIYKELLVLLSGIQGAGPRLTPQSFQRGLRATRFPNPGAAAAPYYQATVGFEGDSSMIEDVGLMWWSSAAKAYSSQQSENGGGWCYVGRGARWKLGQWPRGDHNLFDPNPLNCR